jgi:hypothetical protein
MRYAYRKDDIWFFNIWLNVEVDPFSFGVFDGDNFSFYAMVFLYAPVDLCMDGYRLRFSVVFEIGEGASKEIGGFLPIGVLFYIHNRGDYITFLERRELSTCINT